MVNFGSGPPVGREDDDERTHRREHESSPSKSASSPHLVVMNGGALGAKHPLGERETTIGRAATNDIRPPDESISRTHASVTAYRDVVRIRDHGSKNGILVNGFRVREATLQYGDVVHIGGTVFVLALLDAGMTAVDVMNQITRVHALTTFESETQSMELPPSEPRSAPSHAPEVEAEASY